VPEEQEDEGRLGDPELASHLGGRATGLVHADVGRMRDDGDPLGHGTQLAASELGGLLVVGQEDVAEAREQLRSQALGAAQPVEIPRARDVRDDLVDRPDDAAPDQARAREAQREQAELEPRAQAVGTLRVAEVVLGPVEVQNTRAGPRAHEPGQLELAVAGLVAVGFERLVEQALVGVLVDQREDGDARLRCRHRSPA
jgi:hypothetical protein